MKTNIRVRRNSGSKNVRSQVPNTPEPSQGSAIERRLNHGKHGRELEAAVDQAEALTVLFQEQLLTGADGEWNEDIKAGFVELCAMTFGRLRKAAAAVETLAPVKGGGQ